VFVLPNIKSAKKRVLTSEKKHMNNRKVKSELKTMIKNFRILLENGDKKGATASYDKVIKKLDQARTKGIYHINTISRKKSQLTRALNQLG
jgi:small subunit ribosomal protein S20